jgi:translation initiation factor 2 alpha subunit (eIF-2alpha)
MNSFNRKLKIDDPLFKCKWFKSSIPKKEDIIYGHIDNIGTAQVDITILNYNNIKGIIAFNDLSSKKVRNIHTLIKVGDIKPFIVIDIIEKEDCAIIVLSFKNVNDCGKKITYLENYCLILDILLRWFKNIHKSSVDADGNFSYNKDDWTKFMNLTLWSYSYSKIYNKFLDIKIQKLSIANVFKKLYLDIKDNNFSINNNLLTLDDFYNINKLINTFIKYDININITINLKCWAVKSLDKIKDIFRIISTIPTDHYNSEFTFNSFMINSPNYDFTIKSSNKILMDQLYKNDLIEDKIEESDDDSDDESDDDVDKTVDETINETVDETESNDLTESEHLDRSDEIVEQTNYLPLDEQINIILNKFNDIEFSIKISREDKF